jgi:hypothetical protein
MRNKCTQHSNPYCNFVVEKLPSADQHGSRYKIEARPIGQKGFNIIDTIRSDPNGGSKGNVLISRKGVKDILNSDPSLFNSLERLPKSCENAKLDNLCDADIDKIFLTIASHFTPTIKTTNTFLNNKLSSQQRDAYKEKHSWTCENCGVNCSHLEKGYYLKRSYLIQYHHIDGNKYNNPPDNSNGKALCLTCHSNQVGHKWMLKKSDDKKPYEDMNRFLNSLRKAQGISEVYNSHHGYLYKVMKTNNMPKTIGIWELFKMKMAQITNFFITI